MGSSLQLLTNLTINQTGGSLVTEGGDRECRDLVVAGGSVKTLLERQGGLRAPVSVRVELKKNDVGDTAAAAAGGDSHAVLSWEQSLPSIPGVPTMPEKDMHKKDLFVKVGHKHRHNSAGVSGPSARFETWWAQVRSRIRMGVEGFRRVLIFLPYSCLVLVWFWFCFCFL